MGKISKKKGKVKRTISASKKQKKVDRILSVLALIVFSYGLFNLYVSDVNPKYIPLLFDEELSLQDKLNHSSLIKSTEPEFGLLMRLWPKEDSKLQEEKITHIGRSCRQFTGPSVSRDDCYLVINSNPEHVLEDGPWLLSDVNNMIEKGIEGKSRKISYSFIGIAVFVFVAEKVIKKYL